MAVEYKSIEFKLHEYLVRIKDMLTILEAGNETLSKIERNKELIETKRYKVAVMGEFKRGKSSLINALMGFKALPADAEPATATINRITYGSELEAVVEFKDGTKRRLDIGQLADYVTKLTPDGAARAASIHEAVVYTPAVICQNHVDIIDTPGLNDNEKMTKITIDMLNNVDAVLVAIHARFPFGETERDFVCQLIKSDKINNIVFVVTFLDQLDEDDYIYDDFMLFIKNRIYAEVTKKLEADDEPPHIRNKAHALLKNCRIFGVSSSLALKFFLTNDRKALQKSRFEQFKTELLQIITAKQAENALLNVVSDIKNVLSGLGGHYVSKMRSFEERKSAAAIHAKAIDAVCSGAGKNLSAAFTARYPEISNRADIPNRQKNRLVSGFIRQLASIKTASHSAVAAAVSNASLEQYKEMNQLHLPTIKDGLIYTLTGIGADFLKDIENALTPHLEGLSMPDAIDFDNIAGEIHSFTCECVNGVKFTWAAPTVPDVRDLSNCNVIEHIIEVVDMSVIKLINGLTAAADSSISFSFKRINGELDSLKNLSRRAENDICRVADLKLRTFESNYAVFSEAAKNIIKDSQSVLDALNLGNTSS